MLDEFDLQLRWRVAIYIAKESGRLIPVFLPNRMHMGLHQLAGVEDYQEVWCPWRKGRGRRERPDDSGGVAAGWQDALASVVADDIGSDEEEDKDLGADNSGDDIAQSHRDRAEPPPLPPPLGEPGQDDDDGASSAASVASTSSQSSSSSCSSVASVVELADRVIGEVGEEGAAGAGGDADGADAGAASSAPAAAVVPVAPAPVFLTVAIEEGGRSIDLSMV